MKKTLATLATLGTLALTGCSGIGVGVTMGEPIVPEVQEIQTPDGRTVTCVIDRKSQGVALSCDWEGAK